MSKTFTLMRARQRDRRHLLRGAVAAAGAAMLAGCDRLSQQRGLRRHAEERAAPEPRRARSRRAAPGDGAGVQPADVAPTFRSNGTLSPGDADYVALRNGGFADYKLERRRPGREAGRVHARRAARDAGAHPDHAPRLRRGLELHRQVEGRAAEPHPRAGRAASRRRSSSSSAASTRWTGRRSTAATRATTRASTSTTRYHVQTILAYELNDKALPVSNGAPLRCRVERQLGYKQAKYVRAIELVDELRQDPRRQGRLLGRRRLRVVRRHLRPRA